MQSLLILGRQPAIGLAELEALYGAPRLTPLNQSAGLLSMAPAQVDFKRLGGSLKAGQVIGRTSPENLPAAVLECLQPLLKNHKGKIRLGLSGYGLDMAAADLQSTALRLKQQLKLEAINVSIVPNRAAALNSAQVIHNRLDNPPNIELLLVAAEDEIVIGRTTDVQDIAAYSRRDYGRPKRDARTGMLPPKLAQIIINLATGGRPAAACRLLDPFCGTGVILQEALLAGFSVCGSDLEPRMVDFSRDNLAWLQQLYQGITGRYKLAVADARKYHWPDSFDGVASETYLGKPLLTEPEPTELAKMVKAVDELHSLFLKNIAGQLKPGSRLCLAVPAWYSNGTYRRLPSLDRLSDLGYNRVAFKYAGAGDLIYRRPDQLVGRQLLTLMRK